VETPELEHAIADLSKIVKAPLVAPATVPEEATRRIGEKSKLRRPFSVAEV
jgi:hypothetical protein